jgi:Tol biopolymer transport system component
MNLRTFLQKPIPIWVLAALLFLFISLTGIIFVLNPRNLESPKGRILFWHQPKVGDAYQSYGLYLMDGNGNNINYLGSYTGSPAWSADGDYIAVGCWNDNSKICILQTSAILDFRNFASNNISNPLAITSKELNLPIACQNAITAGWGIQSISWSADGKKIAIVCGNELEKQHEVCILPLNGDAYCWNHSISRTVIRAVFSPVDDRLAISDYPAYGAQIILVDLYGSNPTYLTDGWSPEWSPDGSQIAFIRFEEGSYSRDSDGEIHVNPEHRTYRELVIINKDGTGLHRIYWRPENDDYGDPAIYLDCHLLGEACRLAWSPDGRYIAFASSKNGGIIYGIFRLSIRTGETIFLLDSSPMTGYNGELDWGP